MFMPIYQNSLWIKAFSEFMARKADFPMQILREYLY